MKKYLLENKYPGRGIMMGISPNGENVVIAYFITGRSANSKNRLFVSEGDDIRILPCDESKVKNPSLIIYSPLRQYKNYIIVTNGDQTDTIYEHLKSNSTFEEALRSRQYEPDEPNYTPRVSGIFDIKDLKYKLSILKKSILGGKKCARFFYEYEGVAGIGHLIHTYYFEEEDGSMYPFHGEPMFFLADNDIDNFANDLWDELDSDNRISLFVRYINIKTGEKETRIINRFKQSK